MCLPNMTITIPDDLARLMDACPELNFSEIARQGIEKKLKQIELTEKLSEALEDGKISDKELNKILEFIRRGKT